jgi:hypothetical protein
MIPAPDIYLERLAHVPELLKPNRGVRPVAGLVEREERLDSYVYCQQDQTDETDYQPDSDIG